MKLGLIPKLAIRNMRSDWFGTLCAIIGVALGTATVNVVLTLDLNTRGIEARSWTTNPDLDLPEESGAVVLTPIRAGTSTLAPAAAPSVQDAKEETHEDYQVMRSAIRLGSLSAFLVGALIVFFTFRVVVEQRRREIALLRSIGATAKQVAAIFVLEAIIIGTVGAAIGFVAAHPLAMGAARIGITTTGRSTLPWRWLWFPWRVMFVVSVIGALTAVLGVLRPLREVLKLDVARALRPQFLESSGETRRKMRGLTSIALPFMALLYVLIRPFFVELLPSLAFFVLEAGLVCAGFLFMLVLVPQVVSVLGGAVARILPQGPRAARLLTIRRIERSGHELAWAVSGVMMVFALLLSLHIVTRSLKNEVVAWAGSAVRGNTYLYAFDDDRKISERIQAEIPPEYLRVHFSGRTPRPNALLAVNTDELLALAKMSGRDERIAGRLGPGKIILSRLMSRRLGIGAGDRLRVKGKNRTAVLEVVGVSELGYMPMIAPYRDSKTYGLLAETDYDLLYPYAAPIGTGLTLRRPDGTVESRDVWYRRIQRDWSVFRAEVGEAFENDRVRETNRDFAIFDLILFFTAVLAAVGIANNLVLSAHARRREIALYRVLGMRVGQIRSLFVMEGVFIGALGGLLAVVLGIPLGYAALRALTVVSAFEVHFELPVKYAVLTVLGAVAVSFGASLYPAVRAGGLSGAESVHYE